MHDAWIPSTPSTPRRGDGAREATPAEGRIGSAGPTSGGDPVTGRARISTGRGAHSSSRAAGLRSGREDGRGARGRRAARSSVTRAGGGAPATGGHMARGDVLARRVGGRRAPALKPPAEARGADPRDKAWVRAGPRQGIPRCWARGVTARMAGPGRLAGPEGARRAEAGAGAPTLTPKRGAGPRLGAPQQTLAGIPRAPPRARGGGGPCHGDRLRGVVRVAVSL